MSRITWSPTWVNQGLSTGNDPDSRQVWPSLEEHERQYILEVLDEVEGNKSAAAKILSIDRVSLWRKIKRYGLGSPDM